MSCISSSVREKENTSRFRRMRSRFTVFGSGDAVLHQIPQRNL